MSVLQLKLAVTPLGTAFALTEGWQSTPSKLPLRLHQNASVVAAVAEELGASADAKAFPLFCCDELSSARVMPFFLSKKDLADTWTSAGRPADKLPQDLTVVLLSTLVHKMLTEADGGSVNWRKVLELLAGMDYAGPLVVHTEYKFGEGIIRQVGYADEKPDSLESLVRQDAAYLRSLLAE